MSANVKPLADRVVAIREKTEAKTVSGLYLAHPSTHYFGVGKIERDQVEDYARRKGMDAREAERWLAPILNYAPLAAEAAE